jgi:hypothetical protein
VLILSTFINFNIHQNDVFIFDTTVFFNRLKTTQSGEFTITINSFFIIGLLLNT